MRCARTLAFVALVMPGCGLGPLTLKDSGATTAETDGNAVLLGDLRIEPAELSFGEVALSDTSVRAVVLQNTGSEAVVVRRAQLDGDAAFAIESSTALPLELQGGGEVVVEIAFSPGEPIQYLAGLALDVATLTEPYEVPVRGRGAAASEGGGTDGGSGAGDDASDDGGGGTDGGVADPISASPSSLSFPAVEVGGLVYADTRITNTSGEDMLLTSISGSPAEFSYRRGGEITLPQVFGPGSSRNLSLSWAPGTAGSRSGTVSLTFEDGAGGTHIEEVAVSGTASEPSCTICQPILEVTTNDTPTTLQIRELFSCSRSENVQLRNVGDQDLDISTIYVTNDFIATCGTLSVPSSGTTLSPGETTTVRVSYTATEACIDVPVTSLDTNILHILNNTAVSDYAIAVNASASCVF
jgi:hypothetical protein